MGNENLIKWTEALIKHIENLAPEILEYQQINYSIEQIKNDLLNQYLLSQRWKHESYYPLP